jgi:hypothetical protein
MTPPQAAKAMRSSPGQFDPALLETFLSWAGETDVAPQELPPDLTNLSTEASA